VWAKGSVSELVGGFEPVDEVEVEVVAAGAAVADERKDDDECCYRNEEIGKSIAQHEVRVQQRLWTLGLLQAKVPLLAKCGGSSPSLRSRSE
jgi:hypothetical protein